MSGLAGSPVTYQEKGFVDGSSENDVGKVVYVLVCAHEFLPHFAKEHLKTLQQMEELVVEWNENGHKKYREFIKDIGIPLYRVDVSIPNIEEKVSYILKTGDFSCMHKYERQKADEIYEHISQHREMNIGLILGRGPWEFTKKLFEKNKIEYSTLLKTSQ
jgi:hypothetical protein